eukprot:tig00001668_g9551.t1
MDFHDSIMAARRNLTLSAVLRATGGARFVDLEGLLPPTLAFAYVTFASPILALILYGFSIKSPDRTLFDLVVLSLFRDSVLTVVYVLDRSTSHSGSILYVVLKLRFMSGYFLGLTDDLLIFGSLLLLICQLYAGLIMLRARQGLETLSCGSLESASLIASHEFMTETVPNPSTDAARGVGGIVHLTPASPRAMPATELHTPSDSKTSKMMYQSNALLASMGQFLQSSVLPSAVRFARSRMHLAAGDIGSSSGPLAAFATVLHPFDPSWRVLHKGQEETIWVKSDGAVKLIALLKLDVERLFHLLTDPSLRQGWEKPCLEFRVLNSGGDGEVLYSAYRAPLVGNCDYVEICQCRVDPESGAYLCVARSLPQSVFPHPIRPGFQRGTTSFTGYLIERPSELAAHSQAAPPVSLLTYVGEGDYKASLPRDSLVPFLTDWLSWLRSADHS